MTIEVIEPGLLSTVQDLGRPGYLHLGIPISGAMDRYALRAANRLVGNDEGAALLESVFMGPKLQFSRDAVVAVTGASLPPLVDGEPQPLWTAFSVREGQTLSFDFLQGGARAYIAIDGGVDTPKALGSRSTYAIGALGGVDGRAVQAGDTLPLGAAQVDADTRVGRSVPEALRRGPAATAELRVLPGLYWRLITAAAGDAFFEDPWQVAPEADRMGYRFAGGRPFEFEPREQPFGAGSDPRTSSTGVTPTARSRSRVARSRSCCTATRSVAAATSHSARWSRPTWT